ncbi:MAG: efflux RND transporter periplasmic adaptor subunit [Ignavibacteriales bacterium]|nr:efflux RND transporter periplasmic adaptor subunit [Ignavibacteriales bacterium]
MNLQVNERSIKKGIVKNEKGIYMNKTIMKYLSLVIILFLIGCSGNNSGNDESAEYPERTHSNEKTEVALTKHQVEHINIQTETPEAKEVDVPLTLRGKVALNEVMTAHITSRVKGRVEKVYAVISDRVKKGHPIVDLYSQEFIAMQSEFVQAEERLKRIKGNDMDYPTVHSIYESARKKLEVIGLTETEIKQLADKHTPYTVISVRAPFDGTLISGEVRLGEFVDVGKEFFVLANLQNIWILADVFESDLPLLREGITGDISITTFPDEVYKGKLTRIYDVVEPSSRTIKARFEVANYYNKLKPEMFVDVLVASKLGGSNLKIKSTALLKEKESSYVFVAVNDTTFQKRNVIAGRETKDFTEIKSGINPGEKIVTRGTFYLKSELAKETFAEED